MKIRTRILTALTLMGFIFAASCQKSYTCHCEIKYSGAPGLPDSIAKDYTITDTKSKATSKCTGESGTKTQDFIKTEEDCTLY